MIDVLVPRLLHEIEPNDPGWVLVLESEPGTRDLIHLLLRQLTSMPVALCHNANVAIGLLRQRARPTLAVCGVRFLDDSGPSVLRAIRDRFEGARTRIILLSSIPRNRIGEVLMEFQPYVTLHKPVEFDELQRAFAGALNAVDDSLELSRELLEDISQIIATDEDISTDISFGDLHKLLKD